MKIKKEGFVALAKSARSRILATILLTIICACTVAAAAFSSYNVKIIDGEKINTVSTKETDAKVILEKEGYTLEETDELDTSKFKPGENAEDNQIEIVRTHKITFQDGSKVIEKDIAARNVKEALKKANITLSTQDQVSPSLETRITKDTKITIDRAFTVQVVADGKTSTFKFFDGTVKDVLDYAEIKLGENDVVNPSLDQEVKIDDVIKVSRVTFNEVEKKEEIPFKIITKKTTSLYSGQTKITQNGQKGEQVVTYSEKVVDGNVVESTPVEKKVTKQPVNCIKEIGTKVKVNAKGSISTFALPSRYALDADGIPTNVITTITGLAKDYTASSGANITSCGVRARPGYIAVNPKQIPYGTEMYIVSTNGKHVYGYCIAADTGGFVKRKTATCDLYMNTRSECFQWGNKNVNIYILKWGNGRL